MNQRPDSTQRRLVESLRRERPIALARPEDFALGEPAHIDPRRVLEDPSYSLYCFDPASGAALFVEMDDAGAAEHAAFYYQAQAERAVAVVSMPMETFHRLALEIPEPPRGVVIVHSVGRCGSTLLSKVLQALPEVMSLSEPDEFTQLAHLRGDGTMGDDEVRSLLESSVRWRCKPRAGQPAAMVAIKTRAEVLAIADLMSVSFRGHKHLFLYCDALAWIRTTARNWPPEISVYDEQRNREWQDQWSTLLPILRTMPPLNRAETRIVGWIVGMEGYLALRDAGLEILAIRYEDLVACPRKTLGEAIEFCGLPVTDWRAIDEVLGRDSQAGTMFDREERRKLAFDFTPDLEQNVRDLIAARPALLRPDVVLPGTLGCA
ncbi:MAG TPA: sulfotransferase [Fimbriimonas sp.]